MGDNSVNLAALIGSRICHDLISPIGAINNGLELLDLTGAAPGPELSLIADSVGNAGARIRFFRIAYGAAGDQSLGNAEIAGVLEDMRHGGRLEIEWNAPDPSRRSEVRLAFLALQCLETAMPYGGCIRVTCDNGSWSVTGRAEKINVDPDLWESLSRPGVPEGLTPAHVQFGLLPQVAAEMDRRATVLHDDGKLTITF